MAPDGSLFCGPGPEARFDDFTATGSVKKHHAHGGTVQISQVTVTLTSNPFLLSSASCPPETMIAPGQQKWQEDRVESRGQVHLAGPDVPRRVVHGIG